MARAPPGTRPLVGTHRFGLRRRRARAERHGKDRRTGVGTGASVGEPVVEFNGLGGTDNDGIAFNIGPDDTGVAAGTCLVDLSSAGRLAIKTR